MKKETITLLQLPPVMFAPFFAAGLLGAYFGGAIVRGILIVAFLAAAVFLACKRKRAALCAVGGFCGALVMTLWLCVSVFPAQKFVGKSVVTEFEITEITNSSGGYKAFTARASLDGRTVRVRLSAAGEISEGDIIKALVEFSALDEQYKTHSHAQNILLDGKVKEIYTRSYGFSFRNALLGIQKRTKYLLTSKMSDDGAALALAMLLGDTSKLSLTLTECMKISGVSHYSAVSGTHFAVFTAVLLLMIPSRSKRFRLCAIIALIPLAAAFFGGSLSVIRSAAMIALCFLSELIGRKSAVLNSLCVAVIIICTANPSAVLDAGFQLSVMGVFGAGFLGRELAETIDEKIPEGMAKLRPIIKPVVISACAGICTSPLCIAYFGGVSALGAFTTLIISPLFTCAAALGLFYFITGFGFLASVLDFIMKITMSVICFFGKMRTGWVAMNFSGAVLLAAVCVVILVFVVIFRNSHIIFNAKSFVAVMSIALLLCFFTRENCCKTEFISDGTSGAAIYCSKGTAAILISGGGSDKLVEDIAQRLDSNGIRAVSIICGTETNGAAARAIAELSTIIPVGGVFITGFTQWTHFGEKVYVSDEPRGEIDFNGRTISADKSGSTKKGDIVLYYGYKRSVPATNAEIALYASSQQKLLPENGVNIYGSVYTIKKGE